MEGIQYNIENMIRSALVAKQTAQAMGRFLQTARARKFVETADAMSGETVNYHTFMAGSTMFVQVQVKNLEGMKDERLVGILAAFEFMNPDEQDVSDYAAGFTREFLFRFYIRAPQTPTLCVRVSVTANIKSDSETCRREVIGYTDGKPEPIYKLVCDETENAPAREGA